jgi:hypothetical protein
MGETWVIPVWQEPAFLVVTAPEDARECGLCHAAHTLVMARYVVVPGGIVPGLTVRCLPCDALEAAVPA